ncbi:MULTISPECIES: hypothetical protein [Streptomyces violaceusniger group]|uniref:Uncharacterized protein n=2 Tax=Streptomyces rhizosphaericus TaxID=114699 RepID=A0ABN1SNR1_9ACTN|nr:MULTISPECIES: hypothetical protein [Streptomyces violaceusniger group]
MTKSGAGGPKSRARARQERDGVKYTQARRGAAGAGTAFGVSEPDNGFGGHEFEYEQVTDLFRCTECRVYEVAARDTEGPIKPCTGLVGYGGDTERVYLLLTENPALPYSHVAFLATRIAAPVLAGRRGSHGGTGGCWSSRLPASSPNWPAGSN